MKEQIHRFLEKHNLLSPSQFGFRERFSTTNALLCATEQLRNDIDSNKFISAAFIDFSKAFHPLSHEILIAKLKCTSFGDKAISKIKTYLQNRIQKVILPSSSSDWIKLYQGVPQGTKMGPLLFNIYVDFMRSYLQRTTQLVQYADDTFLYSASRELEHSIKDLETIINQPGTARVGAISKAQK